MALEDISSLRLYARVARLGSFSAAAREAGLAQSQVSRMIAELEAGRGARLLSRTTRAVTPTEAGLEFLARVEPIVAAIDEAENSVRETGELRGLLRVGMPSTMGIRIVMPPLSRFTERHPSLHFELLLEDKWQDMVKEAIDVGIRVGNLPDSSGTAKLIGRMQRVIVASPTYLERHWKAAPSCNCSPTGRWPSCPCTPTFRWAAPRGWRPGPSWTSSPRNSARSRATSRPQPQSSSRAARP